MAAAAAAPAAAEEAEQLDPLNGLPNCTLIDNFSKVWECASFCGRSCIIKQNGSEASRHPILDRKQPTGSRLKQEVRSMCRARKVGVLVPTPYHVDLDTNCLYMEKVAGRTLKQLLEDNVLDEAGIGKVLFEVGRSLAVLHDSGVVHGDLCTANIMVREQDQAVVLLDFSLSLSSTYPEDKGVDLMLLEQDIAATHGTEQQKLFDKVMASYKKHSKQWSATFNRFAEVRKRSMNTSKKAAAE